MKMTLDQALDLTIGDKFWIVNSDNNAFSRQKIIQIIDGEEWYRYDMPLESHTVFEVEVNAIVETLIEGTSRYEEGDMFIEYKCEAAADAHGTIDLGDTIYPSHSCYLTQKDAETERNRRQEETDAG